MIRQSLAELPEETDPRDMVFASFTDATSLRRHKDRARLLLGAARSSTQTGDKIGAAEAYAHFLRLWQEGDAQLPGLREARGYSKPVAAH